MPERPPVVLVIAGVDSSGAAGLTADARAVERAGAFPRTVVTALTVQHARGVDAVRPVDPAFVRDQVEAALADGVDVVKTGLLPDAATARAVADVLPADVPLVVDPVLTATTGTRLSGADGVNAYVPLLARAALATPNAVEAHALTRERDPERAAYAILKEGPDAVLVKGGHLPGADVCDVLVTADGDMREFTGARVHGEEVRGTGCALASTGAAHLAQGYATADAVEAAVAETRALLRAAWTPAGGGTRALPPGMRSLLADARAEPAEARQRMAAVARAWRALPELLGRAHVPEVGVNLSHLPEDGDPARAAALTGRCVRGVDGPLVAGPVHVGGPHHTARVAAAAHRADPSLRAALNLRHDDALVARARALRWRIGSFRRADEPPDAGSSVEWGTTWACREAGGGLDLVWDAGGPGKEAMIRVIGRDPEEVVAKVRRLVIPGAA